MAPFTMQSVQDQHDTSRLATPIYVDTKSAVFTEYCKYCDSLHSPRSCDILLQVSPNFRPSQKTSLMDTQFLDEAIDFDYDPERLSPVIVSTQNYFDSAHYHRQAPPAHPDQSALQDFDFGGYLPNYSHHLKRSICGVLSAAFDGALTHTIPFEDSDTSCNMSQTFIKSEKLTIMNPEDTPMFLSSGNSPEIQSPKPIRSSPDLEDRLMANSCKKCGEVYENCMDESCALERWDRFMEERK